MATIKWSNEQDGEGFLSVYGPTLALTAINSAVPFFMQQLTLLEQYDNGRLALGGGVLYWGGGYYGRLRVSAVRWSYVGEELGSGGSNPSNQGLFPIIRAYGLFKPSTPFRQEQYITIFRVYIMRMISLLTFIITLIRDSSG